VGVGGIHAPVADAHPDVTGGGGAGGRDLEPHSTGMEAMSGISLEDARAILDDRNLIATGARGDEERRRRHGVKTTFVRVFEAHVDAIPASIPAGASAGEFRIVGTPASVAVAVAAVKAARAAAGSVPVTAFSLDALLDLAGGSLASLTDLSARLIGAGLEVVADAPIDVLDDPVGALGAATAAGLKVPRLTVREASGDARLRLIALACDVQSESGGVRAFAPLARVSSIAQPSTGYDDVRTIAVARLMAGNIDSIQVDWVLYGPKLAQVALTMGADDVDGVSPLEGDLGRRRSPLEEIRGNIKAAGLEPIERDGSWAPR
jgi:aminodeoxyfutalosine synthase